MAKTIKKFSGFSPGAFSLTQIPAPFFNDLLPIVDDLGELKVLLFCFWALPQKEGAFPYLRRTDFLKNEPLMDGLKAVNPDAVTASLLDDALDRAIKRGALLHVEVKPEKTIETLYFVNTPRGRAAVEQIKAGQWKPGDLNNPVEILPARPNIYQLYESNLGQLTPMISDDLKDTEREFPSDWIEDAFRIAVQNNARNLRYIRAVLERWRKEGRDSDFRSEAGADGEEYVSGKFADFINH
jgi:DnaD/phage-associated family protein